MLFKIFICYLIVINLAGYTLMGIDKNKAMKNKWRIQENTLIKVAIAGGSVGIWLGMKNFYHKTKHKKFSNGVPAIFFLQVLILILLCIAYIKK